MKFKIKPIRNEQDYNTFIEYFNTIFNAKKGTLEYDEKEVLSILIEKYEDENYTINKPNPIDAIRFRMEQENLTQKELIPLIGSRSKVSEVLSGKRQLTLKMIRALHKHLGIPADILLEEQYDSYLDEYNNIDFEKYPLNEMNKYGAFKNYKNKNIKDTAEEAIRFLIDKIGGVEFIPESLFRKSESPRLNAKVDQYALQGWCLLVLSKVSEKQNLQPYNFKNVKRKVFLNNLVGLSVLKDGPFLAKEYLAKHGIIFEIIPHFKNTYLDGASFITKEGRPVIALTLRYDRIDNFWFTLLHEIAHIVLHLEKGDYIIDDMTLKGSSSDSKKEIEADEFAEKALLPQNFNLHTHENLSKDDIIEYAYANNVHPAIVAGRIQYYTNNFKLYSNLVGRNEVKICFENK
jgi:HTH-type transcriptional regulator / antitoxin HigA